MTRGVYLLHFSEPFGHARHYVGYAGDIKARVEQHQQGKGSRLCQVAVEAGITLMWVRSWVGATRKFERNLHGRGKSLYCPICNPRGWKRRKPQPDVQLANNADVDFYS